MSGLSLRLQKGHIFRKNHRCNRYVLFFRRLSKECGFDVSPHRFRHTLATTPMSSPERNLQLVKGLPGHRNVSTTMEYVDINMDIVSQPLEKEMALYTDKAEEMFYNV